MDNLADDSGSDVALGASIIMAGPAENASTDVAGEVTVAFGPAFDSAGTDALTDTGFGWTE